MGCQIGSLSMGILMYANDLVLISASVSKLQNMVDLCVSVLHGLDLNVNSKKFTCMRIGGAFFYLFIFKLLNNMQYIHLQSDKQFEGPTRSHKKH